MKDDENFVEMEEALEIDASSFQSQVNADLETIHVYQDEIAPRSVKQILKALFTKVINDLGITPDRWKDLVEQAIDSTPGGAALPKDKKVQLRASINKNFHRLPEMTWKKLVEGIRMTRALRFRISITLVFPDDTVTEHALWVKLRNKDESDNEAKRPIRTATIRHADPAAGGGQANAWADRSPFKPGASGSSPEELARMFDVGKSSEDA